MVGWLLIIVAGLTLLALPVTMAAVAARPSQATVRAAGVALGAFVFVVMLFIVLAVLA